MKRLTLLLLAGFLLVAPSTFGQEATGPLDKEYTLVVGDKIKVAVVGYPDLNREYTVPANGEVSFPPLGKMNLLNRSLPDLEREIVARFKEKGQLTDPEVYVLIEEYARREVFLMGAVSAAIEIPVHQQYTIVQVLAKASVGQGAADLRNVKILRKRPDGVPFPIYINVEDILVRDVYQKNIVVMPDDIIYIPALTTTTSVAYVYVLGKVNGPGRYSFYPGKEQMTLTKLIALAGDFNQFAKQSEIRILRKEGNRTVPLDIDFSDIIENEIQDVPLKPDDLIYVPESPW